ncbi:MAG: DUF3379 family protein [Betaproteobacteria bacterium]
MNCLDFHREMLGDPRRVSDAARVHQEGCAACAAFARSVDAGDEALARSLQVPVPDGLADRVLFAASGRRRPRWAWALAASLVLAAGVLLFAQREAPGDDRLARLAIEHVAMEPESFHSERHADADAFRAVLQKFGGELKAPIGAVRYIKLCPVNGSLGWHIVFESPGGALATLLLVPGQAPSAVQTAKAGGWTSLARPTGGGYYAVVAADADTMAGADRLLRERVDWGGKVSAPRT